MKRKLTIIDSKFMLNDIMNGIMKTNHKLTITIPTDSAIEHYLWQHPMFTQTDNSSDLVVFSYDGVIPPLAKISQLLAMFEPTEYTISKSTTGISFIVWSL